MPGASKWPVEDAEGVSTDRRASTWSGVLLTLVAWMLSRLVVGATWGPARNPFSFISSIWVRWDSSNYLSIAAHGTTFGRCGSPGFPELPFVRFVHLRWCGTADWLPGYPWLIHVVHLTGINMKDAGVLISWVATAGAMFLIWLGWGRDLPFGRAVVLLLLFGTFPGSVYNFAVFPTSLAIVCVIGAILAATRERFLVGAVLVTIAGLCYPSAWYAAVGLGVGLVVIALPLGRAVTARRAFWALAGLTPFLYLAIHDQIAFGYADAYFITQKQAIGTPPWQALLSLFELKTTDQKKIGSFYAEVLAFQAVLGICLTGAAALKALITSRKRLRDASSLYPAFVGVSVLLGCLVFTSTSAWNRSLVLAAPSVVCLRRIPLGLLCAIVTVVAITTAAISHCFFNNTLI